MKIASFHSRPALSQVVVFGEESLRVYCACIRIWLMNVLCDLPIWKSNNAFYATRTIHITLTALSSYRDVICGWKAKKRAMKYMLNIYFYYINGFSYRCMSLFVMATLMLIIAHATIAHRIAKWEKWRCWRYERRKSRRRILYRGVKSIQTLKAKRIALDKGHICRLYTSSYRGDFQCCYWNRRQMRWFLRCTCQRKRETKTQNDRQRQWW